MGLVEEGHSRRSKRVFEIYAVYEDGGVVTGFSDDSNPFFFAAARGEINASVTSTINNFVVLEDALQQSP